MKRYEVMLELFFECLLIVIEVFACVYLLPKALGFMWPFVTGWIIAMITYPLSMFFQKRFHISKRFMSIFVLVGLLTAIGFGLYFILVRLGRETIYFMSDLPKLYKTVDAAIENLISNLHKYGWIPKSWQPNMDTILENAKNSIGGIVNQIGTAGVSHAGSIAKNITNFFIGFVVSMLAAYFFVVYREKMSHNYRSTFSAGIQKKIDRIAEQVRGAVGGYLIAQIKIMGIIFVILLIGLMIGKNPYALLLALFIALVDVLPFLGTGFVLLPWAVYSLLVGNYKQAILLVILYVICLLARQMLQPKIIGDSVGLHPLITLVLIYIGFKLDGLRGFLIAMIGGILVRNFYRIGLFDHKISRFKRLFHALKEAEEHL
ncbi:MAG: sporulation integral membrane protein YtvI [Lachnospiraceae bacterium]|nr:sporulation integral membrane protein YtvI [Lachnospiraceae bacterium]